MSLSTLPSVKLYHIRLKGHNEGCGVFPCKGKNVDFVPQEDEIAEIRWVDISYAASILSYENDRTIVAKARNAIKEAIS